jgi:hypothetical protein
MLKEKCVPLIFSSADCAQLGIVFYPVRRICCKHGANQVADDSSKRSARCGTYGVWLDADIICPGSRVGAATRFGGRFALIDLSQALLTSFHCSAAVIAVTSRRTRGLTSADRSGIGRWPHPDGRESDRWGIVAAHGRQAREWETPHQTCHNLT